MKTAWVSLDIEVNFTDYSDASPYQNTDNDIITLRQHVSTQSIIDTCYFDKNKISFTLKYPFPNPTNDKTFQASKNYVSNKGSTAAVSGTRSRRGCPSCRRVEAHLIVPPVFGSQAVFFLVVIDTPRPTLNHIRFYQNCAGIAIVCLIAGSFGVQTKTNNVDRASHF